MLRSSHVYIQKCVAAHSTSSLLIHHSSLTASVVFESKFKHKDSGCAVNRESGHGKQKLNISLDKLILIGEQSINCF
jgi:hypothetical protein